MELTTCVEQGDSVTVDRRGRIIEATRRLSRVKPKYPHEPKRVRQSELNHKLIINICNKKIKNPKLIIDTADKLIKQKGV